MQNKDEDLARMDRQCNSTDARTAPAALPDPIALKPCPFCGGEASFATVTYSSRTIAEQNWGQETFHYVSCVSCGACNRGLVGHGNQSLAAVRWNSRPRERSVGHDYGNGWVAGRQSKTKAAFGVSGVPQAPEQQEK